jgi:hypothetical protein
MFNDGIDANLNPTEPAPHWLIIRSDRGDHPIHLHGHHFQILAQFPPHFFRKDQINAQALWDFVNLANTMGVRGVSNLSNPPRRDTLWVEKGIVYVLAVRPDNPGVWAFHCHNDIHAASGMFSQVIERPEALRDMMGTWTGIDGANDNQHWDFRMDGNNGGVPFAKFTQTIEYALGQALTKFGYNTGAAHETKNPFPPPPVARRGYDDYVAEGDKVGNRTMARSFVA